MAGPLPTELMEAARKGGRPEIERLLEAIWPDAYRLALGILGDRAGAEDAAQEACIQIYRAVTSLRSGAAFRVWFYRIVVREALKVKRRCSRIEPELSASPPAHDQAASIDLWHALDVLPQHLREIVVLRYFEDLPSREIAAILQTTDGLVRFHLTMAKRRLRPLLDDTSRHVPQPTSEVRSNAI